MKRISTMGDLQEHGKKHALLIGVNQYDFLGEISFAKQDAEGFAELLTSRCGFPTDSVQLMTCSAKAGMRAQGRYIEEMISSLTGIAGLDLLLVGFWGHGFTAENGSLFLCGYDAREDQIEKTAVSMDFVRAKVSQVGARQTMMVLDCCQSRAAGRGSPNKLDAEVEAEVGRFARLVQIDDQQTPTGPARSTAVITSCRPGESAYEWEDRQHGIFTAHFLDALVSGQSTAANISSYLARNVPRTAMELFRQRQTPWLEHQGAGDIELYSGDLSLNKTRTADAIAQASRQESSLMKFSSVVRDFLFEFRQNSPCKIRDLKAKIEIDFPVEAHSERTLIRSLEESRDKGLLNGYYFNERIAFLALHLVEAKLDLNQDVKRAIGQRAALSVFSGMCVGIDGGTTTLELARELARMIESRALRAIHIVTNSLITAREITESLNRLDVGDDTSICKIEVIGGWCRPGSLTTVSTSEDDLDSAASIGLLPQRLDASFVGAAGVIANRGFANGSKHELPCKKYFLRSSEQSFVLMESRKLGIELPNLICEFSRQIHLVTDSSDLAGSEGAENTLRAIKDAGSQVIIAE